MSHFNLTPKLHTHLLHLAAVYDAREGERASGAYCAIMHLIRHWDEITSGNLVFMTSPPVSLTADEIMELICDDGPDGERYRLNPLTFNFVEWRRSKLKIILEQNHKPK